MGMFLKRWIRGELMFLIGLILVGCVTGAPQPDYQPDEVLDRMGRVDKTPSWAEATAGYFEEAGRIHYVQQIYMSGNSRPDACLKASALSSRAQILTEIKNNISIGGQLIEDSPTSDPIVDSFLTFLSQGQLYGVRDERRYWEKLVVSDESGQRVLKLRCVSQVSIRTTDLVKQLRAATDQRTGPMRDALIQAQKDFIESVKQRPEDGAKVAEQ